MNGHSRQCPLESREHTQLLLEYCAGHLSSPSQAILEHHIANCSFCKDFCDKQMAVWNALDALESPLADPSFDARLYARMQTPRPWTARAVSWLGDVSWKPAIPAAALLTVYFMIVAPMPQAQPPVQTRAEAQQVEQTLADLEMLQQLKLSDR